MVEWCSQSWVSASSKYKHTVLYDRPMLSVQLTLFFTLFCLIVLGTSLWSMVMSNGRPPSNCTRTLKDLCLELFNQTVWDVFPDCKKQIKFYLRRRLSPLTVQLVTVPHFTLPIASLLFNVESQTRGTTNLLHTSFCAPEEKKGHNGWLFFWDTFLGKSHQRAWGGQSPLRFSTVNIDLRFLIIFHLYQNITVCNK